MKKENKNKYSDLTKEGKANKDVNAFFERIGVTEQVKQINESVYRFRKALANSHREKPP